VLRSRHPSAVARLKAAFRTLAQIAHPNLVAMHELWVDEQSRGVISMDVVRGRSFLGYLRPEPLARRDDTRLRATLEQLVRGVQYLHAHGCLHRDLKPSNVLVSDAGQLTIVNFGLAQSTRDSAELSESTFEGTPAYAAPEQLDAEHVTEASDWYAVGGMLYEALCGQRPFTGKSTELLARKSAHDPPAPSLRTRELVPPELERVCMRLLAPDPAQRAQGDDVLTILGGRPRNTTSKRRIAPRDRAAWSCSCKP
jgi:serine/threonine protein kinase